MPRLLRRPLPAFLIVAALGGALDGCGGAPSAETSAQARPAVVPSAPVDESIRAPVDETNRLLGAVWKARGATPTATADDATFVRRVHLDLTGVVPKPEVVTAFVADKRPDKRDRLVSQLLASPDYARHFTNVWDEVLMGAPGRKRMVDRPSFRKWLYASLDSGMGWDAMARELVAGVGQNSPGGRPDPAGWELASRDDAELPPKVNGAVNWLLKSGKQPQHAAGEISRVMLGVQIGCAECHDHPTEKWSKEDFRRFTAATMRAGAKPVVRGRTMGIRRMRVFDAPAQARIVKRRARQTGYDADNPRALDGRSLDGENPRAALAAWITAKENPWFAKALVNRMWGRLLGRGFVDPVDDVREKSPVEAPEVWAALSRDFVAHGYDLRRLLRIIVATDAYQRTANATGQAAPAWSAFTLRPMGADPLLDSIVRATALEPVLSEVAGDRLGVIKLRLRKRFHSAFESDDPDAARDEFTGTVAQSLMMLNGALVSAGSGALEGSTLERTARQAGSDREAIDALYLAVLSRPASAEEAAPWLEALRDAGKADEDFTRRDRRKALRRRRQQAQGGGPVGRVYRRLQVRDFGPKDEVLEDLLWVLLNSHEFFFIH